MWAMWTPEQHECKQRDSLCIMSEGIEDQRAEYEDFEQAGIAGRGVAKVRTVRLGSWWSR